MLKSRRLKVSIIILAVVLTFLSIPSAVYADKAPDKYLPGQDVVAEGTEEPEPASTSDKAGESYSYPVASHPETSGNPDMIPYFLILVLAGAAALIYRQVIVMDKRDERREDHDAEMEEFRSRCEAARELR